MTVNRLHTRLIALLVCLVLLLAAFPVSLAEDEGAKDEGDATNNVFEPLTFESEGTAPTSVSEVYGDISPRLRFEAFPAYTGRIGKLESWKFSLYGTENLLSEMKDKLTDKDKPYAFRYVLEILGEQDFTFIGNIAYGVQRGDNYPSVTRFNMVVKVGDYRYAKDIHCKRSSDNQLNWLVDMPRSAHFNIDRIRGYRFHIYSAADRTQEIVYDFEPNVLTDTALYVPARRGGALKIDMPDKHHMTLTITDPRMLDGYTNSPEEKGVIKPYWHVKVVLSALEWYEVIIDGTNGEPMNDMKFYCGHYVRELDNSNKYSPRSETLETADGCSYSISGNQLSIVLEYPENRPVDFTYIDYIAIDMNNGTVIRVNQYPLF